ncbi:MAG TPA: 3-hydroxyacyl-CoA dehydrogenase NAD-binding domain-containing protein [Patescibacteria group bacterium]|nr:3-hydroxyacyl-CoA dehydrogenase NAD-binding domain-containing protein [Patescibacteria group bacterium]
MTDQTLALPAPKPSNLKIAIIGGGLMGHALAAIFAAAGSEVTDCEPIQAVRASAPERMRNSLKAAGLNPAAADTVRLVDSVAALDPECHFAVEAVPEDLRMKQELFGELEGRLPKALLATNTSVLSVSDVAQRMKSPARLVGTHWWNPPYLMPLVEVVQGPATRPEYVQWTMDLLRAIGKSPVHVRKDTPGFIGNRMQHALWREAFALIEEGVCDAPTVDFVVRNTLGLKLRVLGPIENADYVGLDMTRAIHEHVLPALSQATKPSAVIEKAIQEGHLGAKSGEGMLTWAPGRRQEVAAVLNKYVTEALKS